MPFMFLQITQQSSGRHILLRLTFPWALLSYFPVLPLHWWDPTPPQKKIKALQNTEAMQPLPPSLSTSSGMGWRWKAAWGTDRQTAASAHSHSTAVLSLYSKHRGRTQQHLPIKIQPPKSWGLLLGIAFPRANGQQTEGNTSSTST